MKKLFVLILAFVHLGASAGVTMHMHYCMGKAYGWELTEQKGKACGKCGMTKTEKKNKKGCCKDEQKLVKSTIDQKTAESVYQSMQLVATAVPVSVFQVPVISFSSVTEENPTSNAPPESSVAVYLSNRVFRI